MKVILNKDLATLGEEGDVKEVAKGYARNFLFPRGIAFPYTPKAVKILEGRKQEIEARKEQKRQDSLGLKERLENLELNISMPAGANGRLYGAVTSQTISDELAKNGFQIERKRVEIAGSGFKSVGKYKAVIKLYESKSAEVGITISAQEIKIEAPPVKPARRGRKEESRHEAKIAPSEDTAAQDASGAAAAV
ncbi:MAG: 50S ribosomal protein L9 [Treponema sp.]|jgi:large subunit ribosomal protein L9|nr:50S ribosomal protein L9 [Treponema sp.]